MDEAGERLSAPIPHEAIKIIPQPLNPEKLFAVNRQTAISEAIDALSSLPQRRGIAIREAIKTLKGDSRNFSLVDLLESKKPDKDDRGRRVLDIILKGASQGKETRPADERRKIWERDPERYSNELEMDLVRRKKEAERRQRFIEASGVNVGQIIVGNSASEDQDFKLPLRELSGLFDPVSGQIILPARFNLSNSVFAKFYDNNHKVGYIQSNEGRVELRGSTFYVAKEKSAIQEKLQVIKQDMVKALGIVSEYAGKRQEISNGRDYLLYLGILDLMKHHSITLFHALTYNERKLKFPSDREEFYKYQQERQFALDLMKTSVRMFYQTLFGKDYDSGVDLEELRRGLPQLTDYIRQSMHSEIGYHAQGSSKEMTYKEKRAQLDSRFRTLEVSNPLMIALGAQEAVKKHSEIDMIVGIPSGGTETALVAQLIFELKNRQVPQMVFLPVSLHSKMGRITTNDLITFLAKYYRNSFEDKRILLVDDNSETGHTLGLTAQALLAKHADEVSVHLVDLSTRRLSNPKNVSKKDSRHYYRPIVSPSTLGLTQLDETGEYAHNSKRSSDVNRARFQSQNRNRW